MCVSVKVSVCVANLNCVNIVNTPDYISFYCTMSILYFSSTSLQFLFYSILFYILLYNLSHCIMLYFSLISALTLCSLLVYFIFIQHGQDPEHSGKLHLLQRSCDKTESSREASKLILRLDNYDSYFVFYPSQFLFSSPQFLLCALLV